MAVLALELWAGLPGGSEQWKRVRFADLYLRRVPGGGQGEDTEEQGGQIPSVTQEMESRLPGL